MSTFTLLLARSFNNRIGHNDELPWHCPEDLKHFKETTENSIVVMGHNTAVALGKPLPNRLNIVLVNGKPSTNLHEGFRQVSFDTFEKVIFPLYIEFGPMFMIGGSKAADKLAHLITDAVISEIPVDVDANVFFPQNFFWVENGKGTLLKTLSTRLGDVQVIHFKKGNHENS